MTNKSKSYRLNFADMSVTVAENDPVTPVSTPFLDMITSGQTKNDHLPSGAPSDRYSSIIPHSHKI